MMPETQSALEAAKNLNASELLQFLVELREVELTALIRLNTPPVATASLRIDGEALLNVKEAAKYLHMSEKWVYNNLDILPTLRIGNGEDPCIRFRKRDLDLWLDQHAMPQKRR